MSQHQKFNREAFLIASFASIVISTLWFAMTWRFGFDTADEGFYWYGAQRVLDGEIPLLDFMAYDIGRYYWAALFMAVLGDNGLFAARLSAYGFQTLGGIVFVYLIIQDGVLSFKKKSLLAIIAISIYSLWVAPYYKVFDHVASVLVVALIWAILKFQDKRIWFISGVALGFAALIGRNHGIYGLAAFTIVFIWLLATSNDRLATVKIGLTFIAGVVLGFSPTLLLVFIADGFWQAFLESIYALFQAGSTNINLPIPWPWSRNYSGLGALISISAFFSGIMFLALLLVPLYLLVHVLILSKRASGGDNAMLLALVVTGATYAHYAFSRADTTHMVLGIFPILIASLIFIASLPLFKLVAASVLLTCISVITIGDHQPVLAKSFFGRKLVDIQVGQESVSTRENIAKLWNSSLQALASKTDGDKSFLALPNLPSLHAAFDVKMPIWEIYSLISRSEFFETQEINAIQKSKPNIIIVSNHKLDNNAALQFSNTHPLTYQWISGNYTKDRQVNLYGLDSFEVFRLNQ